MRLKLLSDILKALLVILAATPYAAAQAPADTIFNPDINHSSRPVTYEIADITVTGVENYEPDNVIRYSGLKPGQRVEIPGDEITAASKRLWRQGMFSNVQILADKIAGNKVWLVINLREQPRISVVNYNGVRKGEQKDLEQRLQQFMPGNQITRNMINRAEEVIRQYYSGKGFGNASVSIELRDDLSRKNEVIVDINVDRHDKVKVHKIYIEGNEVLSDGKLQRVMKKTNEKGKLINLFRQKKFVQSDYKDDLARIIQKYNELGYRDARIVADSVVPYDENNVDVYITVDEGKRYFINDISWVGNTVYSTDLLSRVLGIEKGDVYNQKLLAERTQSDDDAVANLYMNRGYLFYNIMPIERNVHGDSIDLEIRMIEGPQARINNVIINGNDRLYERVIRRELRVKPGELFSKDDLMRSAREIAATGHFNPETLDIQPKPNQDDGTVDIEFNLESKASDQLELSFGWGQTGIIGKVGIKFTNFSLRNLFHPGSYRGLIPQGEGQTLTISAQTNARYYQAYSFSFMDPWFGGKRPTALTVSGYYSRQTGVNSSYYNNMWNTGALYNPLIYGNSNYNYNDLYSNSIQNAYDPNKWLQMASVTVGLGKRLSWPDDYFTFRADLTYNWYNLKNWEYLYYMKNGTSNSIVLGLTLERQSIDNPYYTRRGSIFSLNLQLTPPFSLFRNKDWEKLATENTEASKKELYKWIEYWKLRFKSRTYTPLTDPDGQWTLVLMTRADIGLLGSYNKWCKTPFETFYVGGDGMSGSYTYATETIGMRGYENGQFTPYTKEGYGYTRFGLELHFPFMLQPSTTIYGLCFVEGGNAWTSVSDFQPFNIKRSAGAGIRVFLSMVGWMGIDWAYGFDKVYGQKGGSHFHFILGQEF